MKKTAQGTVRLTNELIEEINKSVSILTTRDLDGWYDEIPLEEIFNVLRQFNLVPSDRYGSKLYSAKCDRVWIEVELEENGERKFVENGHLSLFWYKGEKEDYEGRLNERLKSKIVDGKYQIDVTFCERYS
jgi:hypothetical protein